ncbi:MAG: flagellin, partial [Deferribacterales bacterium]|nr:flagellin [Deferribacterales bacterium]
GVTKSGVMTFEVRGGGEAATLTTKLSDIANFVDSDGNDILQNTQEIRIYGNASFATVLIEGGDTVEDLRDKLTKAIVDDLNMGSSDAFINKRLVEYIPSEGGSGLKAVRGTMLIQSALTGDDSNLSFIGDQRVLDAFGLAEVQSAENNISTVTVSDHHTGVLIGSVVTDEKKAKDLIKGADITIDTRTGAEAVWNPATEAIEFKERLSVENYSMNLHIVESGTEIQIGTSEGESVDVSVPQLDTVALGIDNTVITSQGEAQKAINDLDKAIAMVNNVRATIGAKINRLDSAYATLQAAKENISATESRIRDTDMAEESAALATAQVMSQASLSMLAQANQLPSQALMLLQA